ncbi:MAG: pyridoxamine 5'-phosphate oxidase family protein [Bacteroidales bacterium]|jgi:general stress protein 26|nr:pyridoxamine 5'-phosphate oxidase family protein [Bacteroidales bacterium]
MGLTTLQNDCLELMEKSLFVDFTTIDQDGFPATRAMLNLRNRKLYPRLQPLYAAEKHPLTVYLTTNSNSDKIDELAINPYACLYYCWPDDFHGVLLQGYVESIKDDDFKRLVWHSGWEIYHPIVEDSPVDDYSRYALLRFIPTRLKTYANFKVERSGV